MNIYGDVTFKLPAGLQAEPERCANYLFSSELRSMPLSIFFEDGAAAYRTLVDIGGRAGLLTPYQKRVYDELITGKTHAEIASKLRVSVRNIKFHSANIFKIFGVNRKLELIVLALKK